MSTKLQVISILTACVTAGAIAVEVLFKRRLSKAFDLIMQLEGRDGYQKDGTYKAVKDGGGVATIGYGSTVYPNGQSVKLGDTCTEAQAVLYMQTEATKYYKQILSATKVKLTENQLSALTSFAYNVGVTGLLNSTLWRLLQAGKDKQTVAAEFDKWTYDNGQYVPGLANRRKTEKQIFLT